MSIKAKVELVNQIQAEADSRMQIHLNAIEAEFIAKARERAHLVPHVHQWVRWGSVNLPVRMRLCEYVPDTLFFDEKSSKLFFRDCGSDVAVELCGNPDLRRRVLMNADFMDSIETAPCAAV